MKKIKGLFLLVFMLALSVAFGGRAWALAVPQPTSDFYVLDQANFLSASAEAQFISNSQLLAATSGAQVVVVTLPTLEDESLEDFSLELGRSWGIGDADKDNGVLILLVADSHDIRIEIGYGLESVLPDGMTGRLQREYLVPRLQAGDYDGGVLALQEALIKVIQQDPEFLTNLEDEEPSDYYALVVVFLFFGGLILWVVVDRYAGWQKCPKCGKRKLIKEVKEVSAARRQLVTKCRNCDYLKKGVIYSVSSSTGGYGGGSSSGGSSGGSSGSSGGGGSFGGGGSSGKW